MNSSIQTSLSRICIGTLWIVLLSHSSFLFASCKVDTPAPALEAYREKFNTTMNTIRSTRWQCWTAGSNRNNIVTSSERLENEIVSATSRAWVTNDFMTSFQFQFETLLKSNIPKAIKNEDTKLGRQHDTILAAYKTAVSSCSMDTVISDADIATALKLGNSPTVKQALDVILENHMRIRTFFQRSVIGDAVPEWVTFLLTSANFAGDIASYYHPSILQQCEDENGYDKRIMEDLSKLFSGGGKIQDAMEEWRKAIDLLKGWVLGNDAKIMAEYEKKYAKSFKLSIGFNGISASLWVGQKYGCESQEVSGESNGMMLCMNRIRNRASTTAGLSSMEAYEKKKDAKTTDEYMILLRKAEKQHNVFKEVEEAYIPLKVQMWPNVQVDTVSIKTLLDIHEKIYAVNTKDFIKWIETSEQVCEHINNGGNCRFR